MTDDDRPDAPPPGSDGAAGDGASGPRHLRKLAGVRAGREGGGEPGAGAGLAEPLPARTGAPAAHAGLVVDPRMRSRRIGVRREAGRRRLKRVTLGLGALSAVVGALAVLRSPLLDVDRVTVTGARRTPTGDVLAAAAVDRGDPLIGVDTGAVARRIERLPWVDRARVARSWPATVTIRVTERTAVAQVKITDRRAAIVDAVGRVLAIEAPAAGEGSPVVLEGVGGSIAEGGWLPPAARDALAVAVAARDRLPGVVASVDTQLDAKLAAGGVVRFGSDDRLEEKITAVETVLDQVDIRCLRTLDVRVPGSPALTRNQGCS